MDQCHRQSPVRLPGLGGGQWLYLGGEQSRKSTDALVQRSGRRSLRRSVLPPRRGQPGAVERHCAADSRRWALQRTPRIRLQPFRPSLPGHRHGSGAIRRAGGPDQDFPTGAAQPLRQVTTAVVHQLCGTGTRQRPGDIGGLHRDLPGCRKRCAACAQPLERRLSRACPVRRPVWPPKQLER